MMRIIDENHWLEPKFECPCTLGVQKYSLPPKPTKDRKNTPVTPPLGADGKVLF